MALISNNHGRSARLSELPGELILEILQYLTVTRGYLFIPEEEASRREENAQRVAALHGLTLACRRLNSIATPYLYESITKLGQSSDWRNVDSLLDTIKRKPMLMDFVRYIETDGTKFDVHLGPSMETKVESLIRINYDDYVVHSTPSPDLPCILVVSTLIHLARNLQSLALEDIWHWVVVYDVRSNPGLRDLSLKNGDDDVSIVKISGSPATRFSSALLLLFFSHTGARVKVGDLWMHKSWNPRYPGSFEDSTVDWEELRIVLIEDLTFEGNICEDVIYEMLRTCTSIRRLRCWWTATYSYNYGPTIDFPELLRSLKRSENTLESLVCLIEVDEQMTSVGSLREFTNLTHVEVSGMMLWGNDDRVVKQPRLSTILPSALETLIINVVWDLDVEQALADLGDDCAVHFPSLKKLDCSWRPAPMLVGRDLITKFAELGVSLNLDIASCNEEEEERIEGEMIQMEQDIEYMDRRAEVIAEGIRRFNEERTGIEEEAHAL
jgi:hypothetical protein